MSRIEKEQLTDRSDREAFCFSVECAECGKQWLSTAYPFSRAGIRPETEGKKIIFETLYQNEKEAAVEKAQQEAAGVFNQCPICKRLVCDYCFLICDDLDLCVSCAAKLQEKGEPVMQYA